MAPCPPLKTRWAAAAGCNSRDSETDGWDPVHPSKPSGQPRQVATLGIPRLTDGTLPTPQKPLGSRQIAILAIPKLTDGTLCPSKPSGQPQQVASLGIPRLTDSALGSRGRLHPLRPSKASGCKSRDSETDGWHPVHPSAGCNSRDSLSTPQNPLGSRSRLQF